jgi:predicted DNA-binding transcriptional regulator AlpA
MKKPTAPTDTAPAHIEQHYDRRQLQALGIGQSRTTLWRRVRAGTFPAPIDLGGKYVWAESAVRAWLDSRPRPGGRAACA